MIKQRIDRDIADFDPYFDLIITATCENYPDNSSWTSSTVVINDVNDNSALLDINVYDYTEVDEGFVGRLSEFDIEINDPDQVKSLIIELNLLTLETCSSSFLFAERKCHLQCSHLGSTGNHAVSPSDANNRSQQYQL